MNQVAPCYPNLELKFQKVAVGGKIYPLRPYHPVEEISWNVIMSFISGLNKLSNSSDKKVQNLLKNLIPDHRKGDLYHLPTEAQWSLPVYNNPETVKTKNTTFDDYVWYAGNSTLNNVLQTHPVADKLPHLIPQEDGTFAPFFDFGGNVTEWVKDRMGDLQSGKDPVGPSEGNHRVARGCYILSPVRDTLYPCDRLSYMPDFSIPGWGFRLIKTRK